ncbi:DNA topoisomerase I, partial [Tremellales sp. Uapishka_1]
MSSPEPMAVEAPTLDSNPTIQASHAPKVALDMDDSDEDTPLAKRPSGKRVVSSEGSDEEKPVTKKARKSRTVKSNRRVIESDASEDEAGPSAPPPPPVKAEPEVAPSTNGKPRTSTSSSKKVTRDFTSDSDSEDDKPLSKKTNGNGNGNGNAVANGNGNGKAKAKRKAKATSDTESSTLSPSSEEDKPLAKKKAPTKRKSTSLTPKPKAKAAVKVKKEIKSESEDEVPLAKKGAKANAKDEKSKVKKERKVKAEEDDEDKYKWWEQNENDDGSTKWTTLEHQAVLFPPPYVPLPKGVRMRYDGVPLTLPPESEEVAGFFAAMIETDHAQDAKFRENFFNDFRKVLDGHPPKEGIQVKTLEKCDFRPMYEYFESEKDKKKSMTKEEKKAIKDERDRIEKDYLYCTVDGRREKLGNFRAEPPGLFRGRGEHPKKGTLKYRLKPEDITINIGEDAPVPVPNIPGKWKEVKHLPTVTWLATWKENVNDQTKYVFLAAGSSWKGQSDRSKFEKARELIKHVDQIRKDYSEDLKSKVMADRQRATALYFIDKLALRAGNEKGEDEADTVGCCSLRYEHVILVPEKTLVFDFLGKDSMRFYQEVEVIHQVFKNIKLFKEGKDVKDQLFDRLTTTILNKYLNDQMKGLTAKVFRTYNASWTFQQQLKNTPKNGTIQEKIAAYNTANREVAILCNHQKTVAKNFAESFGKLGDKLKALKYQRLKFRLQLLNLNPKIKKKLPELAEEESDLDDDFMERHEAELLEKAIETAKKKFERENVKLEEEKADKKPASDLKERIAEIKSEMNKVAKERKRGSMEPKKNLTEEKLLDNIAKMDERIANAKVQMGDRDKTKDVALGTSKINYIDPRLTVAWARKYEVPLEKLFSKTLREKFPWAEAEADADWVF